jgi:hypothetical protein
VVEQVVQDPRAGHEQQQPAHDIGRSAGGDVEQDEEHREEQQRRAQIPLDDHDPERDRPHRHHRGEVRDRRQPQGPDAGALLGQQGPVLRQVAGEEHDQDHLEQFGGLAGQGPDRERQAGAVDLAAEHEREQQQRDPGRGPGVLVQPEPGVGPDGQGQGRDHGQGDQEPHQLELAESELHAPELLDHEVLRQALHEQEPDAAQHRDRRQQHLVCAAAREHEREMDDEQRRQVERKPAGVGWRQVQDREGLPRRGGGQQPLGGAQ